MADSHEWYALLKNAEAFTAPSPPPASVSDAAAHAAPNRNKIEDG